jgi:hypothetical protein
MNSEGALTETFLSEIQFDTQSATYAAQGVTELKFKPVAEAFEANIRNAVGLLQLPFSLLMWSHMETKRLLMFTDVYLPLGLKGAKYFDPEVKKHVDEELARRINELGDDEGFTEELCRTSDAILAHLLESPDMQRKIRTVLLSLISATWTAFEVLAGDAWQFALNNRPDQIAQRVLQQMFPSGTAEGLSAKGIPLWMAAKYRFDLRSHIGDLLKPRINFSDLEEIQKAYSAAFGKESPLGATLADKNLLTLETTRHLVVHRGGLVDEKYNKITGENFEIKQPLPLDAAFLSSVLGAGIAAGCALISFVDTWLDATRATESVGNEQPVRAC